MQPGTLLILLIIIPLLASNGAYLLSAWQGFVSWCMPYLEGCTTISQAGRSGNTIYFYRALVFPYSILLIWFWLYSKNWLDLLHGRSTKMAHLIFWLGLAGSISLLIYIDYLGAPGDTNRSMRRFGAMFYFMLIPLAQSLLLHQHYKILRKMPEVFAKTKALQFQLIILLLMLLIIVIALLLAATNTRSYASENIVEWNFQLLLTLYFLGMIFIWKDYRCVYTEKGAPKKKGRIEGVELEKPGVLQRKNRSTTSSQ